MRYIILLACLLMLSGCMKLSSYQDKLHPPTEDQPPVSVYDNVGGIPVWPGVRLGGISWEVPGGTESNFDRTVRRLANYASWLSLLCAIGCAGGIVASVYGIPGTRHISALAGGFSLFLITVSAFAAWILTICMLTIAAGLIYAVYLGFHADRRKQALRKLDAELADTSTAFEEVVKSFDHVKKATVRDWENEESLVRNAVNSLQSLTTKRKVAHIRGKVAPEELERVQDAQTSSEQQ